MTQYGIWSAKRWEWLVVANHIFITPHLGLARAECERANAMRANRVQETDWEVYEIGEDGRPVTSHYLPVSGALAKELGPRITRQVRYVLRENED